MSTILDGGHGHTSFGHNSKFGPPTGYRPFHSNLDQQCQNIADVYVVFFYIKSILHVICITNMNRLKGKIYRISWNKKKCTC